MPAIDRLMKKLGYVKLSSYGLVLTPDGRVLSMRPAVLDDGLGSRIVGWQEDDLAAMELEKWEPARPAPKAAVATRVATPRHSQVTSIPVVYSTPPIPAIPTRVLREASMPVTVAPVPSMIRPAPAPVSFVAVEPVVEEDDWEWTIAIARARAAADEVDLAASQPPPEAPKLFAAKTLPDPIQTDAWPKTEPLGAIDYNDYTSPMAEVVRVVQMANKPRVVLPAKLTPPRAVPVVVAPVQAREFPRGKSPATVIPIPKLPSLNGARLTSVSPVVRAPVTPLDAPRRMAKGTGPYLPRTEPTQIVAQPRHEDDTVTGMILPPVLPSVVKRASRG
ncbi:hypothetical protein BH11MYX3_BH11MYX3_22490 [soil metagenome]